MPHSVFGWSYPPGCSGPPEDDEEENAMYCLTCNEWDDVVNGGHMLYLPPFEDEPATIDYCYGPFVYSEPPQSLTQEDWDAVYDNEPTWEELMRMNAEVE